MKTKLLLLCLCTAVAQAGVLREYEGFNYPDGTPIAGQSGGSGWAVPGTWDGFGLPAIVQGGALTTDGFQPPNQGTSVAYWFRSLGTPLGDDNTTAYASFVLRPEDGRGFYGGVNFGPFFAGLSGDQLFYGLEGGDINLSDVAPETGKSVLFVLRFDFLPGADKISLYLNPTYGAPEPLAADILKTDFDTGPINTLFINNYGGYTTDEIRIGTSFDAVVVPEPVVGAGVAMLFAIVALRRRLASK